MLKLLEKRRGIVTVMSALPSTNFNIGHNFLSSWCLSHLHTWPQQPLGQVRQVDQSNFDLQ
jgi:hypothetical protein